MIFITYRCDGKVCALEGTDGAYWRIEDTESSSSHFLFKIAKELRK